MSPLANEERGTKKQEEATKTFYESRAPYMFAKHVPVGYLATRADSVWENDDFKMTDELPEGSAVNLLAVRVMWSYKLQKKCFVPVQCPMINVRPDYRG